MVDENYIGTTQSNVDDVYMYIIIVDIPLYMPMCCAMIFPPPACFLPSRPGYPLHSIIIIQGSAPLM